MGPGFRVVSREFSDEFGGRLVIEASQAGAIVIGDEGMKVGVAFGMVEKAAVVGGTVLRHPVEMLAEAAVEAFDHAVIRHDDLGALGVCRLLRERVMVSPSGTRGAGSTKGAGRPPTDPGLRARARYMAAPCDWPGCAASADQ
jgi:hypothetical protein